MNMKISHRRDGSVVVFGDADDTDELIIEARVESFTPIRDGLQCACGAVLRAFALRDTVDGAELVCDRCHRIHGRIALAVEVRR
jgi:hypothetical protein